MDMSPSKRRALGPIDSNARNASVSNHELFKTNVLSNSPSQPDSSAVKRPIHLQEVIDQHQEYPLDQPAKKQRISTSENTQFIMLEEQDTRIGQCDNDYNEDDNDDEIRNRSGNYNDNDDYTNGHDLYAGHQRSESPDEVSSMFDNSAIDTSQATTITEPDAEAGVGVGVGVRSPLASPHRQPSMSREEARQKAEKLRLRLGLASYKVRTGQTDVPLDQLKLKPLLDAIKPRQPEQPSLPPLPRQEDVVVEGEDNYEEHQYRPSTGTRKEPFATSSCCQGDAFGQARLPSAGTLLPEIQPSNTN
ncbi:hypothetical protein F4805DRAFT_219398 [Annulohypoxylon moriforme]|nr:hypothetical protein F4805DRAFT_219398 [Annulohypoxylon moriforme]